MLETETAEQVEQPVVSTEVETPATDPAVEQTAASADTFDRTALEAKVSKGLAALRGDEEEVAETPAETDETADASTAEGEEKPAGEEATEDEKEAAAKTEAEKVAKPDAAKTNAPTLPEAFRRSLKAYEMSDEEIDANMKTLGASFIPIAAKIHATRTAETNKWAELGRQARTQQQQSGTTAAATPDPLAALKPVDVEALKKQYGDDKLLDSITAPVNATIAAINKILPMIQATQQRSQQSELETIGRQVEGFFGQDELKPYREMYGTATEQNEKQVASRSKVLEHADALIAGARMQGRSLTVDEALKLAHDSTSGDFKTQAARSTIEKTLKQRAKSISLKPTSSKAASIAKPGDRSSLESKVAKGLAAVFSR